jgi:hypothetical protein
VLAASFESQAEPGFWQVFYDARDEVAFEKILLQTVALEYRNNPILLPSCMTKNLLNFWFLGRTWQSTWQNVFLQIPLLLLAVGGLHVLRKRGRIGKMGMIILFVLYIVAVHAPILAHARYSIPMIPFLAIPASVALSSIWDKFKSQVPEETR